jgi:hypothetical protein
MTAAMALRLRATLLQGIIVIFSKQAAYLLKDCASVMKNFIDALHVPVGNLTINMAGSGRVRAEAVTLKPQQMEQNFFLDSDLMDLDLELGRNEHFDPLILVGESQGGGGDLSTRREDITLLPDVVIAPGELEGAFSFSLFGFVALFF